MSSSTQPFILIVDDNATNLSILSKALKAADYKVRMAVNGEDALAQVERAHPELILLDIQMPKMDGFETCRRLHANPATNNIPVIFMTALADTETKVKGLSLGAVDYITKPFEQEEVLARVKVHWRLKQLTDSLEQQVVERANALQQAQIKLIQSEKMSALGNLVAGIAHEINNPVGFLQGNIQPALDYIKDLFGLLDLYQKEFANSSPAIQEKIEAIDLEFIREDLPKLIGSLKEGTDRLKNISTSLRTFSRADTDYQVEFDIHDGIDSTLLILKHRLKANENRPAIEVITEYGNLPTVECFPGQLNQVFMNILANAIDAVEESNAGQSFAKIQANPNRITIQTSVVDRQIKITITDNGIGIKEEIKQKMFDHLFTTKEVGKGTGLGLAIARQIIEEKHGGAIEVNSQFGQGTEFILTLPLN